MVKGNSSEAKQRLGDGWEHSVIWESLISIELQNQELWHICPVHRQSNDEKLFHDFPPKIYTSVQLVVTDKYP